VSHFTTPTHQVPEFGICCRTVYGSLVQQTREALRRAGFSEALIGLSGGIDSALVATIAVAALGAEHVHGLLMPAAVSSVGSVTDARELAERLGIEARAIPIESVFATFKEALADTFSGSPEDVTEENLQARIRGTLLMALSNKFGWFVLNTGNYSESLMGYGTLHGDMVGGFAPLGQLLKTQVYELARYCNEAAALAGVRPPIPEATLSKEPSAELAPGQLDRDALGGYEEIDPLLYRCFVQGQPAEQLVAEGFSEESVRRVLSQAQRAAFKLRYEPPAAQAPRVAEAPHAGGRGPVILEMAPDDLPEEARALIYDVLYRDYGVTPDQDWLNAADGGRFFVAHDPDGQVCGVGRLMAPGSEEPEHGRQVRQLATAVQVRGQGIGTAMMEAIEAAAHTQGASRVWLKARQQAWGFYLACGYQFEGPGFSAGECMAEDGLFVSKFTGIPHKIMAKQLD